MEIYTLDRSSIKNFGTLLSEESRVISDNVISLGAIEDAKPAGILRFYIDVYGNAIILHFCVSAEFRRDYIGMRLFLKFYEILKESGAHKISCMLGSEEKKTGAVNFLKRAGFVESTDDGSFVAPLYYWMDSKVLQVAEKKECIKSLDKLTGKERVMLFEELFKESDPGKMGLVDHDSIDNSISCYFDEEFGKGCILIAKHINGTFEVIRFGISGGSKAAQMMLLSLIRGAMDRAAENCEPDARVMVRCSNETNRKLVEKLWPGIKEYEYASFVMNLDDDEEE